MLKPRLRDTHTYPKESVLPDVTFQKLEGIKQKKPLDRSPAVVSLIFLSLVILDYFAESATVVSAAAESATVEST